MVRPGTTCLGVEYFCFRGDDLWELSEEAAVRLAAAELAPVGLVDPTASCAGYGSTYRGGRRAGVGAAA
jgi:hypothetical protein